MKKFIAFIMLSLIFSVVNAQERKLQLAPMNPEFIRYMEMVKKGEVKKFTSKEYLLGYIPNPMKFKREIPLHLKKHVTLPDRYDLRDEGTLTSVKDQQECGCCWAFATMGSIESRWLDLGLGDYDLSENNLRNGHGFLFGPCDGGNAEMATAYLSRGDGPISEADDPYEPYNDGYISGLTPQAYIPDAWFLPNDMDILKQIIYDSGAVCSDMFWEDSYYNSGNYTYYCNVDSSTNHGILLVGWDDNKDTAGGKGAWIIRNSWGTSFGDSGFFYISYNDTKVNENPAFWPNRMDYDSSATVYYYDKLGCVASYGWVDTSLANPDYEDYGLVKFDISDNQKITKVGTWIPSSNSIVCFYIYDDFKKNALSDLLASTGDQTCVYPGYYTFDLPSSIDVNSGDDIYIKVKYNTPETQYSIPVEIYIDGYANPSIETCKCWISDTGNNGSWLAVGSGTGDEFDLCIRAYGVSKDVPVEREPLLQVPSQFALDQNYPNPFNLTTTICYSLPTSQHVMLKVYDILGREVAKLVDERKKPGYHKVNFDATKLASGIYFYQIKVGDKYTQTRKLTLLK